MRPTLSITFPYHPLPKERPRFSKGKVYTPEATRSFEFRIRRYFSTKFQNYKEYLPLTGPLRVNVKFYLTAKQVGQDGHHTHAPDIDNLLKSFFDGLNKVAWEDDSQIVECHSTKAYSDNARIELTVFQLED